MSDQAWYPDGSLAATTGAVSGLSASSPYVLPQLMEAAQNCVKDFCLVRPGERVLVLGELDTEPLIVSAIASAAKLLGAEIAIMSVGSLAAGGYDLNNPSDIVMGAMERVDVVIACTYFEIGHADKTFFDKLSSGRQRVCSLLMSASIGGMITGGRFPIDLFMEIGKRAKQQIEGCRQLRITTPQGTDITIEGLQNPSYGDRLTPGSWAIFPQMGINYYPANSNGVLVVEDSTITGRPAEPIKFIIKDNFLVAVEGGSAADAASVEAFSNGRYYLRHGIIGLNPKARLINAPQFERSRAAGSIYLGIDGTGPEGKIDRSKPGYSHLDMVFDTPTVHADDKLIVDRRRLLLLDDPTLHEFASRYGNPKRLLAQNPFLW